MTCHGEVGWKESPEYSPGQGGGQGAKGASGPQTSGQGVASAPAQGVARGPALHPGHHFTTLLLPMAPSHLEWFYCKCVCKWVIKYNLHIFF